MAYGNVAQRRMVVEDIDETRLGQPRARSSRTASATPRHASTRSPASAWRSSQADRPRARAKLEQALGARAASTASRSTPDARSRTLVMCRLRRRRFDARRRATSTPASRTAPSAASTPGGCTCVALAGAAGARARPLGRSGRPAPPPSCAIRRSPPVARGCALHVLGPRPRAPRRRRGRRAARGGARARASDRRAPAHRRRSPPRAPRRRGWPATDEEVGELTGAALSLALERRASWEAGALAYWRRQAGLRDDVDPRGASRSPTASRSPATRRAPPSAGARSAAPTRRRSRGGGDEARGRRAPGARRAAGGRGSSRGGCASAGCAASRAARDTRTRENPAGLTARELEVLALLAEGLRNAQIAERLVLSEKTVGHHVSAVLRKLDVRHARRGRREGRAAGPPPRGSAGLSRASGLLPQPHGFERLGALLEHAKASDPTVLQREHERGLRIRLDVLRARASAVFGTTMSEPPSMKSCASIPSASKVVQNSSANDPIPAWPR